ncbi:hypothetical protein F5050DRAFT_1809775 [Lentinula boryana]|uniref:Uncharacterized protein n=1 Tax=Lentinula boryana TaxID=40481 RepID=A0ABQ8Q708_9AGAR|nr:hypothetical protein F5050DRAFT_1809775 [Lentinula boryana]
MARRTARPTLNLRTSYDMNANIAELPSPNSLASSIPATCSPLTPKDAEQSAFNSREVYGTALDDVFTGERNYFQKVHYREDRTYLPPLSEVSDQGSIYSQDSACVVYTSHLRPVANVTPKSALTFAAIWDPDHGMSTFSGKQLLEQYVQDHSYANETENGEPVWIPNGYDDTRLSSFLHDSGHSDCEPHLPSRFSTTTTSTSNYIEVDLAEEDQTNLSSKPLEDDLIPGDCHPAWIPQIFTLGYTKSPSYGAKRPEISEPFQLAPMQSPELKNHNNLPSHFRLTSKSSSLFSRSRLQNSTYIVASTPAASSTPSSSSRQRKDSGSARLSPTTSVRRGFSFGSSHVQHSNHSQLSSSILHASPNTEENSQSSAIEKTPSRPQTPTRRPSITSVLGKLKSPRKGQPEAWVLVDVEVTPTIRQRLVTMSTEI